MVRQLATGNRCVFEASGGAEALALVEEGACQTLLLDQVLPDLNVAELVAIIRARHPEVEIQMLDSQAWPELAIDDMELPSDSSQLFHCSRTHVSREFPKNFPTRRIALFRTLTPARPTSIPYPE